MHCNFKFHSPTLTKHKRCEVVCPMRWAESENLFHFFWGCFLFDVVELSDLSKCNNIILRYNASELAQEVNSREGKR